VNRLKVSCAALATALILVRLAAAPAARAQERNGQAARPRLIVMLVVDQMRGDYLTEYGATFTAGLRRLTREGAWFTQAAYPYLNTVTCAGHATIGTGTFPYQHGMILNGWLDRKTGRTPYCTDDATVQDISYNGLTPATGDSPALLLRPSLAEQVHERGGRTVVMSLKPRSSIPVAGHKAAGGRPRPRSHRNRSPSSNSSSTPTRSRRISGRSGIAASIRVSTSTPTTAPESADQPDGRERSRIHLASPIPTRPPSFTRAGSVRHAPTNISRAWAWPPSTR
jgi:predicted AlkP superfamily pyrophosphatase or phosphodiesterase